MKKLGIYIHVPFCKSKCYYCDFCSFPSLIARTEEKYVDALCDEIRSYRERAGEYIVDTMYFGGGTPTLLSIKSFEKIFSALYDTFKITDNAEITAECNPETVDREYLGALRALGINRLSIGVQSADDGELLALGRIHNFVRFEETFENAREAGFDNISVDIMLGIPLQTEESLARTLENICALDPEHISAYGLKIEEGTPFYERRESLALPDEETERKMYFDTVERLRKHGYFGYEISNFSHKDKESAHNLKYWRCEEYIGVGLSAHSFFDSVRYFNTDSMDEYLASRTHIVGEELSIEDKKTEFVMLSLRLSEGIDIGEYKKRFSADFESEYGQKIGRFIDGGFAERTDVGYRLTREGMYVSNYILSEIL